MGFLKEILQGPDDERPLLLIPVGYPAADATGPTLEKKPFGEVVEYIR